MKSVLKTLRRLAVVPCGRLVLAGGLLGGVCDAPAVGASDFAFVTTTDYTTGSSSVIRPGATYTVEKNVAAVHSDAVARYYNGRVFVVNREGADNIQILDPANGFSTVRQFTVGTSSNPHDIAVVGTTKAYVTRYDETALWIVDPSTGAHTGSIDLSALADADGIPEMDQMAVLGDRLFVTIQRIDQTTWGPSGTSYVAVIDIATDTLIDADPAAPGVQPILLTGTNPVSDIQLNPCTGKLHVPCEGFLGLLDGGVEIIDPIALESEDFLFTEVAAGGDIGDVEIICEEKGYAIITNASFNNVLIAFDPSTGTRTGTLYAPGDFVLNDIEISPERRLFLTDRTPTRPGIRVYDTYTDEELTSPPLDVGLPPFDICFSSAIQTGVRDNTPVPAALGENYPNPFNPETTIPFSVARAGRTTISIYDPAGRRVRLLIDQYYASGAHVVGWDGRDDAGGRVASGVYFVKLETGGYTVARKLVVLK
ncbi:MAG: T9SS type A sorting domain-containing protein [bacterium]